MQAPRLLPMWTLLAALGAAAPVLAAPDGAVSRAQVRAEAAAAVAAGTIPRGEATPDYPRAAPSTRARDDVRAETLAAVRQGLIPRGDQPLAEAPAIGEPRAREEVKAETRVAMRLGLIPRGDAPAREATDAEREQIRLAGERARAARLALSAR